MQTTIYHRLKHWGYRILQGLLALLSLILLGVIFTYASRPARTETTEILFKGVTYTRQIVSLPRKLVVHLVEVDLTAPGISVLVTPSSPDCGMETCAMTTGAFLKKNHLQLAINGSFFSPFSVGKTFWDFYPHTNDPTDILGLAISDGVQYSEEAEGFVKICFTQDIAQITEQSCPDGTQQAIAGGDMLVRDGSPANFEYASGIHPRTAVAVSDEGQHLWLVVVDGRQDGYSEGIDLNELAELIARLGASEALNLDGGGSTTLVTAKHGPRLLNAPMHTRIPMRQRPVANHLGIYALPETK